MAFAERGAQIASPAQGSCVASSNLLKGASDYRHGSATTLTLFSDAHRPAEVAFGADSVVLVNPCDGRIWQRSRKAAGFFSKVRDLHRWVALNGVRHERLRSIKDACVVAFLFMILSGLVIWFPRKLTWQHLRPAVLFRRGLRSRAREWNWHNVFSFLDGRAACGDRSIRHPHGASLGERSLYRVTGDHLPAERAEAELKRAAGSRS